MKSTRPLNIALMASGNGTNAQNLMEYAQSHADIEVVGLISDKPEVGALERAKKMNIPVAVCSRKGRSKEEQESEILETLRHWKTDWICLCGYMRILGRRFLEAFPLEDTGLSRVINIHPSLLPAFPGINAYQQAYSYGVKLSGVTVHLVDQGMDTGPIILQKEFARHDDDSIDDFQQRGLALEHQLYRQALEIIRNGRLHLKKQGTSWYVVTDSST